MSLAEEKALFEDMKAGGPYSIDPIKVVSKRQITGDVTQPDKYVVLDGNHRLKAAFALGWEKIRVIEDTSVRDEVTARVYSYTINFERGHMEPFKEAENFSWLMEKNRFTQDELAKELHIDRTTVSKRLSLLKIPEEVRTQVRDVPRITVSHLEAIAPATPEVQKQVAKGIVKEAKRGQEVTVAEVQEATQEATREAEIASKLKAALEDPKSLFKKCPACGQPPSQIDYNRLPWVRCQHYDPPWNLHTGKTQAQLAKEQQGRRVLPSGKVVKKTPQYIRSTHTVDEFKAAFMNLFHEIIPRLVDARDITISGRTTNPPAEFHVRLDEYINTVSFDVNVPGHKLWLSFEKKNYPSKKLKEFKTKIEDGRIKSEADLKRFEDSVMAFFEKYATKKGSKAASSGHAKIA